MLGMFGAGRRNRSMNDQAMGGAMPQGLVAPQLQTMPMPQMPQATQPQAQGNRGGGFRNIAGVLGDMLAQASGGQGRFLPQMMQDRQQERQLQMQRQQQAEERAYEQATWQQRQDYQRTNPEPRYFEDNAGNQWRAGANGNELVFRDPTPRFNFVQAVDADGNTVMQRVEIPNNVPVQGGPQAMPQPAAPQSGPQPTTGGLRPMSERQAAPMRQALGERGFQEYLQRQGLMVVPDGANATSPQDAIVAEMRRRGLM